MIVMLAYVFIHRPVAGRGVEEYTSRPEKGLFDHQAEITAMRVVHRS
jgi:hypothetical protein